jgi:hypothetical protein
MKTALSTIFTGTALWTLAMVIPLIMWYVNSGEFKTAMFLIYPMVISILSRTGWFWVRPEILAYSSIIAFLYGTLLRRNENVRKSMDEPQFNKTVSAVSLTSITAVFLLAVVLLSMYFKPMYNPENFSS